MKLTNDLDADGNNISNPGTVDGRDVATDGSKLDGIEGGATADQTASEILAALLTVDGTGSGLDADTLQGAVPNVNASNSTIVQRHSSGYIYANYFNTTCGEITTPTHVYASTDTYIRKVSLANLAAAMGSGGASGVEVYRTSTIGAPRTEFGTIGFQAYRFNTGSDVTWDSNTALYAQNNGVYLAYTRADITTTNISDIGMRILRNGTVRAMNDGEMVNRYSQGGYATLLLYMTAGQYVQAQFRNFDGDGTSISDMSLALVRLF